MAAIFGYGAKFQLWGEYPTRTGILMNLLDEELVSAYSLSGTVKVVTEDPYDGLLRGVFRTRSDRPIHIEVIGEGFSSDPSAPVYARQMILRNSGGLYLECDATATATPQNLVQLSSDYILTAAMPEATGTIYSSLGDDIYTAEGEESFSLFRPEVYARRRHDAARHQESHGLSGCHGGHQGHHRRRLDSRTARRNCNSI